MLVVLFRSRLVPQPDSYAEMAQEMLETAKSMPGFVDVMAFTAADGERLTLSGGRTRIRCAPGAPTRGTSSCRRPAASAGTSPTRSKWPRSSAASSSGGRRNDEVCPAVMRRLLAWTFVSAERWQDLHTAVRPEWSSQEYSFAYRGAVGARETPNREERERTACRSDGADEWAGLRGSQNRVDLPKPDRQLVPTDAVQVHHPSLAGFAARATDGKPASPA